MKKIIPAITLLITILFGCDLFVRPEEIAIDPDVTGTAGQFISIWNTNYICTDNLLTKGTGDNQIRLPLLKLNQGGDYCFLIDWGDNQTEWITSYENAIHTYAKPGVYSLTISGKIKGICFFSFGDRNKLIEIKQWGCLRLGNSGSYFDGCANLEITATDTPDLTDTTTLNRAFNDCTSLKGVSSMNNWDVSKITEMSLMFSGAFVFNADISRWDVSSVTNFENMFSNAVFFNQDISSWKISNATNMMSMFSGATGFNQGLCSWEITKVDYMAYMFYGVTLSESNYDAMLAGWSRQSLRKKVNFQFDGGYSRCSSSARAARQKLIADYGWIISDADGIN
jgi:hypothetical protein